MKPLKRRHTWIATIALSAAALAYAYFIFLPGQAHIVKLRDELRTKQDFVQQTESFSGAIDETQQKLAETNRFIDAWRADSPYEGELGDLFGKITACINKAGAGVKRFDPEPAVTMHSLCNVSITLRSEGEFSQVFELLRQLESNPESIWVKDLRIEPIGKDNELVQCDIVLTAFADNRKKTE